MIWKHNDSCYCITKFTMLDDLCDFALILGENKTKIWERQRSLQLFTYLIHQSLILCTTTASCQNPQILLNYQTTFIIQYSSTVYRDHEGLGFLAQKYHPESSLIFYFVADWLGIAEGSDTSQMVYEISKSQ